MDISEILFMLIVGVGMGFSLMGMSTAILFSPILVSIYGSKLGNGIMFVPFLIADLYVSYLYRNNYDKKIFWNRVCKNRCDSHSNNWER